MLRIFALGLIGLIAACASHRPHCGKWQPIREPAQISETASGELPPSRADEP